MNRMAGPIRRDWGERNRLLHSLYNQDCCSIVSEQEWKETAFWVHVELEDKLDGAFNGLFSASQVCDTGKNFYR